MKCPYCRSEMIGKEGSRICSNMGCGAYQVNDRNYNITRKNRVDLKPLKC